MKNKIIKIVVILFITLIAYNAKCYAESSLRMEIKANTKAWTHINVSDSYSVCEQLNLPDSSLGTTSLEAHLTTDADWSAMAIFSASQYGGATNNAPNQTNSNITGIYGMSIASFSTGILKNATKSTNSYISGLFNEDGTVKKYIRQWDTNKSKISSVWFNETFGYFASDKVYNGYYNTNPISTKKGLFGTLIGDPWSAGNYSSGIAIDIVTFRPVIWN